MAINWQDVITTLGTTVGGSVALLGAAAWLIRAVISQSLVRDADAFKIKLKADADTEIERLKSALQITAAEHEVRFAKLHEKRAEVIAELYHRAVETNQDGERFVLNEAYDTDKIRQQEAQLATNQKLLDLYFFVEKHRIYLPEQTCTLLNAFVDAMRKHVIRVGVYGSIGEYPTPQTVVERNQAFEAAYKAFQQEIPEARRALEHELRTMLGVENSHLPNRTT